MEHANAFQFLGICTTCHTRHAYLNVDGTCLTCSVHASRVRFYTDGKGLTDAGLPPRQGWDIGVCIRCGFIKTCHENVCRDCREHDQRPHDPSPRLHQDDDPAGSRAELVFWRQVPAMMTDTPEWTEEPTSKAYTLLRGGVRGRVWRRMGTWEAIVSEHGGYLSAGDFRTAEEAKAWCEERIAERSAGT